MPLPRISAPSQPRSRAGNIPLERIITHRTDFDKVTEDLPRWAHDKDGLIKAMITLD